MQAKDIPDLPILRLLADNPRPHTYGSGSIMPTVTDAMPPDTPEKVGRAKMRRLILRGLVDGCGCGCRGDWVITQKGREYLAAASNNPGGHDAPSAGR